MFAERTTTINVGNPAHGVTDPSSPARGFRPQSNRGHDHLTAFVDPAPLNDRANEPSVPKTRNRDEAVTTKKQLTPSTTFRRTPDDRLGRRRHSVPRPPKSKADQIRGLPVPIARQELPERETQILMRQQATLPRLKSPPAAAPPAIQVRNALPISNATTTKPLATIVKRPASKSAVWLTIGDIDPDESTPTLVAAQRVATVTQPPASTNSPADLRPTITPQGNELLATPDRGQVAEEIAPPSNHAFDRPLAMLKTNIDAPPGEFPTDVAAPRFAAAGEVPQGMGARRSNVETVIFWDAPAIAHRPLYFEEVNLERHGYKVPLIQPVLSGAHFFGRIPALPYLMFSENHRQLRYTLGHYRPGSRAPYTWYAPRASLHGGVIEAAAVTGLLFAFP
jgi:hypothetical protein